MSILQRICQCGLVDQSTSSAIDDAHSTLCFLQTCSIEKMSRFWCERCVQTDEIGSGEEIIQFVHELNLQRTGTRRRQIGIIRDHPHAESDGAANHAKACTSLQNIRCHFRLASDNKRAELEDDLE